MAPSKNSYKREIYSDTGRPHEINKKPQINNLTLHQKEQEQEKRNLHY